MASMDDYFYTHFNTEIPPEKFSGFVDWMTQESKRKGRDMTMDLRSYDLQGYWLNKDKYPEDPKTGHITDKYKKPNHITFSDESIYHGKDFQGGNWKQRENKWVYTPSKTVIDFHGIDKLKNYFSQESGSELNIETPNYHNLIREPYNSELSFFKKRPEVGGMYTKDRKIILNPYSNLNEQEKKAVVKLEGYRLFMDENNIKPKFDLTPEQINKFKGTEYGKDVNALKLSIISRILVGDPSAGNITPEQKAFAEQVRIKASQKSIGIK